NELSGGGCRPDGGASSSRLSPEERGRRVAPGEGLFVSFSVIPVPDPIPASPRFSAGLRISASDGSTSGLSGRCAFPRVGRAGSPFECFAGSFLRLSGDFAIAPNMGPRARGGKGSSAAFQPRLLGKIIRRID